MQKHENGDVSSEVTVLQQFSQPGKLALCYTWAITTGYLFGDVEESRTWCQGTLVSLSELLKFEESDRNVVKEFLTEFSDCSGDDEFFDSVKGGVATLHDELEYLHRHEHDLIEVLISQCLANGYDSRIRTIVLRIASLLDIDMDSFEDIEHSLLTLMRKNAKETDDAKDDPSTQSDARKKKLKKAFFVGLATVGGGAALALSAGLAAPLIGAGAAAVLGGGAATAVFTGATGTALITSIFGVAGAGLSGYKMNRRIGKMEQFEFGRLNEGEGLSLCLAVSGWLGEENDSGFKTPWGAMNLCPEQYCLKWESKYLAELGNALVSFLKNQAVSYVLKEGLKRTALNVVLKSIAWPLTLIQMSNLIDNPWNTCTYRAQEVGKHLAGVLRQRFHGRRPLSLIGFSLGARVIYFCLLELSRMENCEGIVENVYFLGAPVGIKEQEWQSIYKVVGGTIVNCYSRTDWLLKFVYRTASAQVGSVLGLAPIEFDMRRLKNVDLTDIISGHLDYADPVKIFNVLRLLGVRTTAAIKTDPDKQQLEGDSEEAMLDGFQPSYVVEDAEDNYV